MTTYLLIRRKLLRFCVVSNSTKKIDLVCWYDGRKLLHKPIHFLKATSLVYPHKHEPWIIENCKGRYYIDEIGDDLFIHAQRQVYFEDMSDLVYYELTWS